MGNKPLNMLLDVKAIIITSGLAYRALKSLDPQYENEDIINNLCLGISQAICDYMDRNYYSAR